MAVVWSKLFLMERSDEMFAAGSGVVHSVHCRTRGDLAFYANDAQMENVRWQVVEKVEVRFRMNKGNQGQTGSVRVRARNVRRAKSCARADATPSLSSSLW